MLWSWKISSSLVSSVEDATTAESNHIVEHKELFPGITAQTLFVRKYPSGSVAAHVLGTVAPISPAELKNPLTNHASAPSPLRSRYRSSGEDVAPADFAGFHFCGRPTFRHSACP